MAADPLCRIGTGGRPTLIRRAWSYVDVSNDVVVREKLLTSGRSIVAISRLSISLARREGVAVNSAPPCKMF